MGLTLMEVLVAMLVVALGLLGIASLQANTLRHQLGTAERAALTTLLSDYIERVRANVTQAPGEVANSPYLLADAAGTLPANAAYTWSNLSAASVSGASKNCSTASCTAPELAAYDMAVWRQAVRSTLPRGVAVVSGKSVSGIEVTFAWSDKDFRTASAACAAGMTGLDRQSCCPTSLGAAGVTGVRCANFTVMP